VRRRVAKIARVILTHETGRDGFWLARFLARRGIEVHVIQPRAHLWIGRPQRAKTDIIDIEMLLRTLMAWLRGEPRVCSMAPSPSGARAPDCQLESRGIPERGAL
jgi:transposase